MAAEPGPEERYEDNPEIPPFQPQQGLPVDPFLPQNALPNGLQPGGLIPHWPQFQQLARIYQSEGWEKAEEYLARGRDG